MDAAQLIDTSGFYGDRGRVPLFYFDEFELPPTSEGQKSRTPVFFKKADLLKAWEKNNAGVAPPTGMYLHCSNSIFICPFNRVFYLKYLHLSFFTLKIFSSCD